jgi:hypothetical protein
MKNGRGAAAYVANNEREQQKENERVSRERMRRLMVALYICTVFDSVRLRMKLGTAP